MEPIEFGSERTASPALIAQRLIRLAEQLESGKLIVDEQEFAVADKVYLVLELEEQHTEDGVMFELEIELSYPIALTED
jgi:hypothetical protein